MPKPETTFILKVHRHLSDRVYREKMANPYRGGTPDVYAEGDKGSIWLEYKYLPRVPSNVVLPDKALSRLQQFWLRRCHGNGRPCAVIVGHPDGGVIYPGVSWEETLTQEEFLAKSKTVNEVAKWVEQQILHSPNNN